MGILYFFSAVIFAFHFSSDFSQAKTNDRVESDITAEKQGTSKKDVGITKEIRSDIISDKNLSLQAHNITIITQNGTVTLKGPVRSAKEKLTIAKKAESIAGPGNVQNELVVASRD